MSTPRNDEDTFDDAAEAALVIKPGKGESQKVILDGCNIGLKTIDRPVVSIENGDVTISPEEGSTNSFFLNKPWDDASGDQVGIVTVKPDATLTFAGEGRLRIQSNAQREVKTPILGIRGSNIQFNSGDYYIKGNDRAPAIGDMIDAVTNIRFAGADVDMASISMRGDYPCVGSVKGDVSDISFSADGHVKLIGSPCIGSTYGSVSNIFISGGIVELNPAHMTDNKRPLIGSYQGAVKKVEIKDSSISFMYDIISDTWELAPVIGTSNKEAACSDVSISGGKFDIWKSTSDWEDLTLITTGQEGGGAGPVLSGGKWTLSMAALGGYGKPDIVEYPEEGQRFLGISLPEECVTYYVKRDGVDKIYNIIPKTDIGEYDTSLAETLRLTYNGKGVDSTEYDVTVYRGTNLFKGSITKSWCLDDSGDWTEWKYTNDKPKLPGTYCVRFDIPKSVDPDNEKLYAPKTVYGTLIIEPLELNSDYDVTIYTSKPYDGTTRHTFENATIIISNKTGDDEYSMSLTRVNGEAEFNSAKVGETGLTITRLEDVVGVSLPEGVVTAKADPGIVAVKLTRLVAVQVKPRHYDGTDDIDVDDVEALIFSVDDSQDDFSQDDFVRVPIDAGFTVTDVALVNPYQGDYPSYPYNVADFSRYVANLSITQWPDNGEGFNFDEVKSESAEKFEGIMCVDENLEMAAVTRRPVTVTSIDSANKVYDGTTELPNGASDPVFSNQLNEKELGEADYKLDVKGYASKDAGKQSISGTIIFTGPRYYDEVLNKYGDDEEDFPFVFAYLNSAAWNYEIVDADGKPTEDISSTATGIIYKKPLTITGVTVKNKANDGTLEAEVESVTFNGLVKGESLTLGKDYTATASFSDSDSGEDKPVTVTVTLLEDGPVSKNYTFEKDSLTDKANATASITDPKPGGGGSSGGQTKPSHAIEVEQTAGGSAQVDKDRAPEDSEVTVTATPDAGKQVSSVTVVDEKGNEVEVTPNDDGTWTFEMPGGDVTVRVTFACDGGALCPSEPYPDVDQSQWYHAAVDWAISGGVMTGYGDGTFGPDRFVTRSEAAAVLWNAAGKPALEVDESALPADVPAGEWYTGPVAWSLAEGIFNGNGDGSFAPAGELTREQAACVLYNRAAAAGEDVSARADLSRFGDAASVSGWEEEAMSWAVAEGVFNGNGQGLLEPGRAIARSELCAVLMNWEARG